MIEQLLEFYYKYDKFQNNCSDESKIRRIYEIMHERDRLHMYLDNSGELLGYGESWRINFEQFGRIVCGQNFYDHLEDEDIETGNIAYLANVTIHPDWRGTYVLGILRNDFFTKNYTAEYFCGHAKRKKHQPMKVFTKQQAFAKWVRKEVA